MRIARPPGPPPLGKNCYGVGMSMQATILASGDGWRVGEYVCSAGPADRPFEEAHASVSIAFVTSGTFQYRSTQGSAVLAPGSLLLGNYGTCYRCGHDHSTGDRCISFHFDPSFFEATVSNVPGVRRADFGIASISPTNEMLGLLAAIEAAGNGAEASVYEELALRLAAAVAETLSESQRGVAEPSHADARRISDAVQRIEASSQERISLAALARAAGMSRYHFLRTFRRVVGMTPHQYVLRTRLHRAAVRIRGSQEPISTIAFDEGFEDLSTFNRRFRQMIGVAPGQFRGAA